MHGGEATHRDPSGEMVERDDRMAEARKNAFGESFWRAPAYVMGRSIACAECQHDQVQAQARGLPIHEHFSSVASSAWRSWLDIPRPGPDKPQPQ
jgi:acetone carboxylase gamma subunit